MTKVTRDQFEWDGNTLTHKPTGARFNRISKIINYGNAGDTLKNGECYEREDVYAIANEMALERNAPK